MRFKSGKVNFKSNQAGGILGGFLRTKYYCFFCCKTDFNQLLNKRETIKKKVKYTNISVKGRHDPCVGIRAVPIGEAMIIVFF